ncbi:MAG TPA: hypothetical protein VG410_10750 [Solirubrobacteraceae bacterium]|jgi:hypothetical protein|nr:hypothetical protein [Solirubrobacteraceae bacterium]
MIDDGDFPLELEQIESTPLGRAKIGVRVTGRWRVRGRPADQRAFLVLQVDGRRHRFPAMQEPRRSRLSRSNAWSATFALPAWLEPRLPEQMSLWLGSYELELPSILIAPSDQADTVKPTQEEPVAEDDSVNEQPPAAAEVPVDEEPREPAVPAPAADPAPVAPVTPGASEATVAALRAELRQRAATEAQLRAQLTSTKAELDGRVTHQTELEATHEALRSELQQLVSLVEEESGRRAEVEARAEARAAEVAELQERVEEANSSRTKLVQQAAKLSDEVIQLRAAAEEDSAERVLLEARTAELTGQVDALGRQLAESDVGRESANAEVAGLRAELDRLGAELVDARNSRAAGAGLSDAQSLLIEARAVTARLRGRDGGE